MKTSRRLTQRFLQISTHFVSSGLGNQLSPYEQVLFCYEPYDELVLMQLQQFDKKTVTSVEKEMRSGPAEETVVTDETLELKEQTELTDWVKVTATQICFPLFIPLLLKVTLGQKAAKIKTTSKLESHPCVVTVEEMAAARHFIKTQVRLLCNFIIINSVLTLCPIYRVPTSVRSKGSRSCSHSLR